MDGETTGMRHSSYRPAEPLSEAVVLRGAMFFGLLSLVFIALVVSVVVLVNGFASARKSAYTQAHGVPRAATVTSVDRAGPKDRTEDVDVSLADPFDGQQSVTAFVPGMQSFPVGAGVRVLIDPQDPGYVEMAGEQFKTNSDAWAGAEIWWMLAAALAAVAVYAGHEWRKQRRAERRPSVVAAGTHALDL